MEEQNQNSDQAPWSNGVSRRTATKGAVWSTPVIMIATAAPARAASCPEPTAVTRRVEVPEANTTNTAGPRQVETLSLPGDVTTVQFEALGGAGGISFTRLGSVGQGGNGELVVGTMTVPAGSVLTLIAGNGGASTSNVNQGTRTGGQGYGNGGDSLMTTDANRDACAGSGGGGSAILVSNTPAVIAGGGGGSGVVIDKRPRGQSTTQWIITGGDGGDAATQGQDLVMSHDDAAVPAGTASGGGGATGATPGAGRGANASTGSTTTTGTAEKAGTSGGAPGTGVNGGADGATGSTSATFTTGANPSTVAVAAAGGGGGYAGGASGGLYGAVHNRTNAGDHLILGSGGGGGGSSFTSPDYVASFTTSKGTNRPTAPTRRSPGYVQVTYETCEQV